MNLELRSGVLKNSQDPDDDPSSKILRIVLEEDNPFIPELHKHDYRSGLSLEGTSVPIFR